MNSPLLILSVYLPSENYYSAVQPRRQMDCAYSSYRRFSVVDNDVAALNQTCIGGADHSGGKGVTGTLSFHLMFVGCYSE
jgi:hypothetical protein